MISVVYGTRFLKAAAILPKSEQNTLSRLIPLMVHDPFDARLHSKKLSGPLVGLFSFRVGRDWRVLYQFLDAHTVQLTDIGRRKDVYR